MSQHIHVEGRPDWVFVKVYTHGAWELQADSLFGAGGNTLHEILTTLQQIDRLREGDDQRYLHRFTQHLVVTSCICFGAVPFDQLR